MLACSSHNPQATRADASESGFSVLELSAPAYDAAGARGDGPQLAAQCARWALTREQAETFLRLSRPISGEEMHHAFYVLPCNIKGRVRAENRTWDVTINAAATATLTSGNDTRLLGCSDQACGPLVLMMPEGGEE